MSLIQAAYHPVPFAPLTPGLGGADAPLSISIATPDIVETLPENKPLFDSARFSIRPVGSKSTSTIAIDFEQLYLAVCNSKDRADATVRLSEWLAKSLPGINVRCGLGGRRLKRFFDSRLGWLGAESNLQRELADIWNKYVDQSSVSTVTDSGITIKLQRPGHSQFALLCLSGERVSEDLFVALRNHEVVLGSMLWGRPTFAIPQWSTTKGRPRTFLGIALLMVGLLLVCPVPYRAACTVLVEPVGARAISAPFAATLEAVFVEPGDEVHAGQPLLALDGRPLRLEQQSIDAEIQQAAKQQDVAFSAGRIAEGQLAQFKCQQLQRQRDLLERRLGQLSITSPINGVVVAGDLRQSIGTPLEIGQVLVEIARLDRVTVEVEIPEVEIGLVSEDSVVQLRVDSARAGTVDAALTRIYPAAQLRDDQSVFVAPIEIDNEARQYRPGMRGKATVYGPIRPWAWSHLHKVFEELSWLLGL